MKSRTFTICVCFVLILTLIAACDKKAASTTATAAVTEAPAATETPAQTTAPTEAPAVTTNEDPNALPSEPQPVSITTADGKTLEGYYYPSAKNPAPLVIFMHWMMGDKSDWNELAVWLQNRGQVNPFPNPGDPTKFHWWDPTWFPEVPADDSYAVLTFTYRDCLTFDQQGCTTMDDAGRLQDSYAAMLFGRELEGIDQNRIVAIGSSIGADGAADACLYLNQQYPDACQGAYSLSPGDWLGVSYVATVAQMGSMEPPIPAWCVADEKEYGVCEAAQGAANTAVYKPFRVPGGDHGNMLLSPDLSPLPMQLILDFLAETVNE